MWRNYSKDYIKNNRTCGISIMAAAFIAALFLSLLCHLFYNFWIDNIEGTKLEMGDWHGRITGELGAEELDVIRRFANVENVVLHEDLSGEQGNVADILFYRKGTVYKDMSAIVDALELTKDAASYNYQLLSLYFVRIPGDDKPRLIMPAYLAIVFLVCCSLILVIHNSFAVSMNGRIHQFGIFSSIGATPAQIRLCLLQEAVVLALAPIIFGILIGMAISAGVLRAMSVMAADWAGVRTIAFVWSPAVLATVILLSLVTVLVSAWIPARKLSKLTPLEAIRGTGERMLKRGKSRILPMLFGMEGELAGSALRAQKKALRTTSLSLTLAFLGFMLMQCFFTLSGISTNHTYFEAYQDVWDVMVMVKNIKIEEWDLLEQIKGLPGARDVAVYQRAEALAVISVQEQSEELLSLGGLGTVAGSSVSAVDDFFLAKASVVILDDESFAEYCRTLGIASEMDGAVLINRIWDSINSNFRYRKYVPYLAEDQAFTSLQIPGQGEVKITIPVLACVEDVPSLREEYDNYSLVHVLPVSVWKEISAQIGGSRTDTCIRVLAEEISLEKLDDLEKNAVQLIGAGYELESENRIRERMTNDEIIRGYELVLGGFCVLLAIIGIAHVFSNTLGFLRQRKREFARYLSIGLTPEGIRKVFMVEALVIVGRPVFITLVFTIVAVAAMLKASYLDPAEFIAVAPIAPIAGFILAVFGFVALAYYLGGRKIVRMNLAEALRDDTML